MSAEATAYVWTFSPYEGREFTIHLAMADIVNDLHGNELWIRQALLAAKARTARESVARFIPRATGDGLLRRLSPDDHSGKPVRYQFLMPDRPVIWRHTLGVTPRHTTSNPVSHVGVTPRHTELELGTTKELKEPKTSSEGDHLCLILADLIESNGSKRPTITDRWRTEAEKMIRLDGRTVIEAEDLIRWCQSDPFWRANVLSMPTFRNRYDQLRLKSQNGNGHKPMVGSREWAEGLAKRD